MTTFESPHAVVLVAECDAFLGGRSAEMIEAAGLAPPPWAWMNLLAHGTEEQLREAASEIHRTVGWRVPRAYVAGEMLQAIDQGRTTLRQLQWDVLVPLELDVLACPNAIAWTPGQLAVGLLPLIPAADRHWHATETTAAVPPAHATIGPGTRSSGGTFDQGFRRPTP